MVYLLVAPIVLLVKAIRKKKVSPYPLAMTLSSLALILNNLVLFIRVGADTFGTVASGVREHIILNYVFGAAVILLAIPAIRKSRSEIAVGATTLLMGLFLAVLVSWNFFVL